MSADPQIGGVGVEQDLDSEEVQAYEKLCNNDKVIKTIKELIDETYREK